MGSCCETPKDSESGATCCPRCEEIGRPVANETILAILNPESATPLLAVERRFCRNPNCDVLYYGADGRVAPKTAAIVRVGVKESKDPVPVCYCFGFTRSDVRAEIERTGDSSIPDRIKAEMHTSGCACATKNPSGACCLGEVRKVIADEKVRLATTQASHPATARR
jgi:hypothetical protein